MNECTWAQKLGITYLYIDGVLFQPAAVTTEIINGELTAFSFMLANPFTPPESSIVTLQLPNGLNFTFPTVITLSAKTIYYKYFENDFFTFQYTYLCSPITDVISIADSAILYITNSLTDDLALGDTLIS